MILLHCDSSLPRFLTRSFIRFMSCIPNAAD
jgi:hypothetical protein